MAQLPFGPDLVAGYGIPPRKFPSLPPVAASDLSSTTKSTFKPQPPPFDLIAEVYLDGPTRAEISSIIYLDPNNIFFSKAPGLLPGRRVRSQSKACGAIRTCIHDWVFTDVGIEVLLERMGVDDTNDSTSEDDQEVAGLADMLKDAVNVDKKEQGEEELKIGKTEVIFTRVVLGDLMPGTSSKILRDEKSVSTPLKNRVGKDVTHTTR
jgi:hypothetical protein